MTETHEAAATAEATDPIEPAPRRVRGVARSVGLSFLAAGLLATATYQLGHVAGAASVDPVVTGSDEPAAAVADALAPSVVRIEHGAGQGSGVVYAEGLILTAGHVIAGASTVTVTDHEGNQHTGEVAGVDPATDTGVIRLDAGLPVAALADEPARVGQTAIAIGSPFGLDATVTMGIVSALDRSVTTGLGEVEGLIQTDAPINPGSSGGPLADADARVIGINHAIASRSGGNEGVGFALPIEIALASAEAILAGDVAEVPDPIIGSGDGPLTLPGEPPELEARPFSGLFPGPWPNRGPGDGCGLFGLPRRERPCSVLSDGHLLPGYVPQGYQLKAIFTHRDDDIVVHRVTLADDDGDEIVISAGRGGTIDDEVERIVDDPGARSVEVDGAAARVVTERGAHRLAWRAGDLSFTVTAPVALAIDEVVRVAESLQQPSSD